MEYKCVNGHDLCSSTYPNEDCPYCERVIPPWKDPNHPGNKIRPRTKCLGCGRLGCITAWGNWCFNCNVKRITKINKAFGIKE